MKPSDALIDGFRGCAHIRRGNEPLLCHAYGYADLANEIPNTMDTKFATASAGKAFVAVGILQLIEKGALKLGSTLGDTLTLDLGQIDPDVTVEQLLTHTSGVPDYFDESVMDEYEELWTDFPNYKIRRNADLFPLFITKPMMYPKGERFQYNNSGYVLLAQLIEQVSGLCFDDYLKQNVFDPCGMVSTGYYELDRLPAKCANSYIWDEKTCSFRTNIFSVDAKGTGAGGAFTTVCDVARFWDGLMGCRLLSKDKTHAMLTPHSGDDSALYGYGLWLRKQEDQIIPHFEGCDPGVSFISEFIPSTKTLLTFVSNYGDDVWRCLSLAHSRLA